MPTETPRRFERKVVFITGAARGQGRAEAVRFAAEGADIIALDICADLPTTTYPGATPADLAETARLVEKYDRRVVTSITDVRDFDGVRAAVQRGVAELGRLDVVVANAGMTTSVLAWEIPLENWDATIGICLTGAYYTARAAIPVMLEQGTGGAIIFTSSVAGLRGLPLLADYVAAKHGVTGLAKTLANELGKHRIRVNSVHPHGVNTDLKPGLREQVDADPELGSFFQGILPDPVSEAEDIAAAVAWLASDEARHVTGIQLPVDLGRTNRLRITVGSIYCAARLDVPADVAWDYLDRFTRAEVLPFSSSAAGRREGEYRVVTMPGGQEIWERNVSVDPVRRRTSYTIQGLNGAEHHHAEMRVDVGTDDTVTLVWVTDYLPHELAEQRAPGYAVLFDELVAAVNAHGKAAGEGQP